MESPAIDARRCEGMGGNAAGCCTGAVLVVLVVLIELVVLIVLVVFGGLEAVFFRTVTTLGWCAAYRRIRFVYISVHLFVCSSTF